MYVCTCVWCSTKKYFEEATRFSGLKTSTASIQYICVYIIIEVGGQGFKPLDIHRYICMYACTYKSRNLRFYKASE